MKKCPYCAEEIQDDAIKCKHCGEFLVKKPREKWYFGTNWLILAFLGVGPLALPLLWINPRFSRKRKVIVTMIIIILSYYLTSAAVKSVKMIGSYYHQIFQQEIL